MAKETKKAKKTLSLKERVFAVFQRFGKTKPPVRGWTYGIDTMGAYVHMRHLLANVGLEIDHPGERWDAESGAVTFLHPRSGKPYFTLEF